jgi:hypothetical protein
MVRRPLAHLLLRHAHAELRRLARVRGPHRRTERRRTDAAALAALAAALLGPTLAEGAPRFVNPRDFFGIGPNERFARPAFGDLDADGDLDAVIGTRGVGFVYYENAGSETSPVFGGPQVNAFGLDTGNGYDAPVLADLDGDGDLDVLTGDAAGELRFLENTGTRAAPAFAAEVSAPFGLTAVGSQSSPSLGDFDDDGDLDALVFDVTGDDASYFANTGAATAPAFAPAVANPFGIDPSGTELAPALGDLDGDGDLDLLVGIYGRYTFFYRNSGTAAAPAFEAPVFPALGIQLGGSNTTPALADFDGDGDLDLASGEYAGSIVYQENTGTDTTPAFAASPSNPIGLPILNTSGSPDLGDLDGDGDLDLLYGLGTGTFALAENTGGASAPTLAPVVTSPFGLGDVGNEATVELADLDGDGDLDVWSGEYDGGTFLLANTGSAIAPAFAAAVAVPDLGDVGDDSAPSFLDADGDLDLDAFVGNSPGDVLFFENTGTETAPDFAGTLTNPFGLTNIGFVAAPTFADLDGDGDLDAVVGTGPGALRFFENTGGASAAAFTELATSFGTVRLDGGTVPTFGDLDGDSDLDLVVGGSARESFYFRNAGVDCPPLPLVCPSFGKASLTVNEKKAGKESLSFSLSKGPAFAQADLGDPLRNLAAGAGYGLCLYDEIGARIAGLAVERPGQTCGTKPCWKPVGGAPPDGDGYRYKDATGAASGVRQLALAGGAAGKTKISGKASNNAKKSQTAMPTGITAALAGATAVTVQVRTSEGDCFTATLPTVKKSTATQLKATLP